MISAHCRAQLLAPLALLILCAAGCSKENKIDQSQSQRSTYVINPDTSGLLPGPDGLQLQVSKGSVDQTVTIEVANADPMELPPNPQGVMLAGVVYSFVPHGFQFKLP